MKKLSEMNGVVPSVESATVTTKHGNIIAVLHWDFFKRIGVKYGPRENQLKNDATAIIKKMFGSDIKIEFQIGEFDVS